MYNIKIADRTICDNYSLSFKEKIEIARLLDKANVDKIDFPATELTRADTLLIRTIGAFVNGEKLSIGVNADINSITAAKKAFNDIQGCSFRIEIPVSPVGMEYTIHKKPDKLLSALSQSLNELSSCHDTEICLLDATRGDMDFIHSIIELCLENNIKNITIFDNAAALYGEKFKSFINGIIGKYKNDNISFCIYCSDKNNMAQASMLSVSEDVACIKTTAFGDGISLYNFTSFVRQYGNDHNVGCNIKLNEIGRITGQIEKICDKNRNTEKQNTTLADDSTFISGDSIEKIEIGVRTLGYDLSNEDLNKVYGEFCKISQKKPLNLTELDAIVSATALQVPPTYILDSYSITTGNIMPSAAQIRLKKGNEILDGICMGDGPIDAGFKAIEQIVGRNFILEDFSIQTITGETGAMGSATVKLRDNTGIYGATGISVDILDASLKAYISALNKIVYEE